MKNLIIMLLAVCMSASAFAKDDKVPQISEVLVAGDQVFIVGSHFDEPEVSLGEFGLLLLDGLPSPDLIVAYLPDPIDPGDYKLTVSQGDNGKDQVSYDLTIGAVGPQGETGPTGASTSLSRSSFYINTSGNFPVYYGNPAGPYKAECSDNNDILLSAGFKAVGTRHVYATEIALFHNAGNLDKAEVAFMSLATPDGDKFHNVTVQALCLKID